MTSIEKAMRLIPHIGLDTYLVGGCVRDAVMNIDPHDIDIATKQDILIIRSSDLNTYDIGQSMDFGITGVSFQGEEYEVAQFRSDGEYTDSRHPDSVKLGATITDDAQRRDFTINAMYMDADGIIHDFHNGQQDIQNKIIRCVGNPTDRFEEDALRIIRAHRFAARFGFKIDVATKNAMISKAYKLKNIAAERISAEMIKVAGYGGKAMAQFIEDMIKTDVIRYVLPEIIPTTLYDQYYKHHPEGAMVFDNKTEKYMPYSKKKHGDTPSGRYVVDNGLVFDHIMAALRTYEGNDPMVTLSILFHDIGKPECAERHPTHLGYKFIGHDRAGVKIFKDIAERLKFSSKMSEEISFCIQHHMRFHVIPKKATKIIPIRQSPYWETMKQVTYADDSCRGEAFDPVHQKEVMDAIERIYETFGEKEIFDARIKKLIDGKDVMEAFPDLKGAAIGKTMAKAKEFIIEHEFKVTKEDVMKFIKENV